MRPGNNEQHVNGKVLGPNGDPIAGATVVAYWGLCGAIRRPMKSSAKLSRKLEQTPRGTMN